MREKPLSAKFLIPAWRVCYFLRFEVTSFDCDYAAENDNLPHNRGKFFKKVIMAIYHINPTVKKETVVVSSPSFEEVEELRETLNKITNERSI